MLRKSVTLPGLSVDNVAGGSVASWLIQMHDSTLTRKNSPKTQIYGTLTHRYMKGKLPVLLVTTQLGNQFEL